jgi:PAS domain S-box-containing protein
MAVQKKPIFDHIFGADDPIRVVEARALNAFGPARCIVWEGNPETFQFTYVSPCAESVLGYSCSAWLDNSFWAGTIVHPQDRSDAIAYCALATAKGKDHDFVYRARRADGSTVWLHDVVKVIRGPNGIPVRLQGLMFQVHEPSKVVPVFEKVLASSA